MSCSLSLLACNDTKKNNENWSLQLSSKKKNKTMRYTHKITNRLQKTTEKQKLYLKMFECKTESTNTKSHRVTRCGVILTSGDRYKG